MQENHKLSIKQWAPSDRPCERIKSIGAQNLSDAELLAVLIGSGTKRLSAVEVARQVLAAFGGSLNNVGKARFDELTQIEGIGFTTACRIAAAVEIGKRRQRDCLQLSSQLTTAARIYNYILPVMKDLDTEEAHVILMNHAFGLIRSFRLAHGGISEVTVDVRIVIREAVLSNATILALCHNHPSGRCNPSKEDDAITRRIQQACDLMRVHFADHVIVTDGHYYSYRENGRL